MDAAHPGAMLQAAFTARSGPEFSIDSQVPHFIDYSIKWLGRAGAVIFTDPHQREESLSSRRQAPAPRADLSPSDHELAGQVRQGSGGHIDR